MKSLRVIPSDGPLVTKGRGLGFNPTAPPPTTTKNLYINKKSPNEIC